MDIALSNALKRQAELREELEEIDRFLKLYEKFQGGNNRTQSLRLDSESQPRAVEPMVNSLAEAGDDTRFPGSRRGWTKEMLRPHLRRLILEAGRPLTRGALLRILDQNNIPVGGSNRSKNMGTIMWRLRDDFVSLEGLGYWPKDVAWPEAGYNPNVAPAGLNALMS